MVGFCGLGAVLHRGVTVDGLWPASGVGVGGVRGGVDVTVTTGQVRQSRRRQGAVSTKTRTLGGVWLSFSVGIMLYVAAAAISHHIVNHQVMFVSTICFMLGTVNVTSAAVYRWYVQGMAGVVWWAAGVYTQFTDANGAAVAFLVATFLAQIVFGLYLMARERRRASAAEATHA